MLGFFPARASMSLRNGRGKASFQKVFHWKCVTSVKRKTRISLLNNLSASRFIALCYITCWNKGKLSFTCGEFLSSLVKRRHIEKWVLSIYIRVFRRNNRTKLASTCEKNHHFISNKFYCSHLHNTQHNHAKETGRKLVPLARFPQEKPQCLHTFAPNRKIQTRPTVWPVQSVSYQGDFALFGGSVTELQMRPRLRDALFATRIKGRRKFRNFAKNREIIDSVIH